ncbi:hypothetical protein F0562_024117 [Nyssa sinensis]|uniref:Uncharacterized protein n=1 Tax=Nyssa sinensis TaxID=561372 RepID=A0A5J5BJJ3_9ASTE|nr:hypothetical protein F0562_024117 [Nyssa sinensis]
MHVMDASKASPDQQGFQTSQATERGGKWQQEPSSEAATLISSQGTRTHDKGRRQTQPLARVAPSMARQSGRSDPAPSQAHYVSNGEARRSDPKAGDEGLQKVAQASNPSGANRHKVNLHPPCTGASRLVPELNPKMQAGPPSPPFA